MTRQCPQVFEIYEDRLVKRWSCRCHGERSQGKRINEELKASMFIGGNDIHRIYVEKGMVQAIKTMYYAVGGGDLLTVKRRIDGWIGTPRRVKCYPRNREAERREAVKNLGLPEDALILVDEPRRRGK